jgi:hypothetical protein
MRDKLFGTVVGRRDRIVPFHFLIYLVILRVCAASK